MAIAMTVKIEEVVCVRRRAVTLAAYGQLVRQGMAVVLAAVAAVAACYSATHRAS